MCIAAQSTWYIVTFIYVTCKKWKGCFLFEQLTRNMQAFFYLFTYFTRVHHVCNFTLFDDAKMCGADDKTKKSIWANQENEGWDATMMRSYNTTNYLTRVCVWDEMFQ